MRVAIAFECDRVVRPSRLFPLRRTLDAIKQTLPFILVAFTQPQASIVRSRSPSLYIEFSLSLSLSFFLSFLLPKSFRSISTGDKARITVCFDAFAGSRSPVAPLFPTGRRFHIRISLEVLRLLMADRLRNAGPRSYRRS